jgi:hypothetical protein
MSLGKLKKRHVMETRELRRTVQDMSRGKLKQKKHTLDGKRNRKEIGKEIQKMERELDERQAAEIAHVTRRNQLQSAHAFSDFVSREQLGFHHVSMQTLC